MTAMGESWNEDRLLATVGQIYEAAADPARLGNIVALVQKAMDIGSALVMLTNHNSGELVQMLGASANFDAKARADYRAHYHDQNPWYQAAKNREGIFIRHGGELIDYTDFEKTEFRSDWCTRMGIYHFLGGTSAVREGLAVAVGLHKGFAAGSFSDEDKRAFSILLEHIVRACFLADKIGTLKGRETKTFEMLSQLGLGFILMDSSCRPLHVNGVAENILKSSRWLTYSNGTVRPVHPGTQPVFKKRVADAAAASGSSSYASGGPIPLRDPIEQTLKATVLPFRSAALGLGLAMPAAALVFSDPDNQPRVTPDDVAMHLGLSAAEARLVACLVAGNSMVDAARQLGISPNTAKTQLQSAFQKTGCTKQSELVALVVSNPLLRMAK